MQQNAPAGVQFLLNPEYDHHLKQSSPPTLSSFSPTTQNLRPRPPSFAHFGSVTNPNPNNMAAAVLGMPPPSAPTGSEDPRQDLPRPYKCPLCEKAFHRLEHQTRHIRTHTGEKPHACQYPGCQKRFSRSDELTRHSRIHNNPQSRRGNKAQNAAAAAAAAALANGPLPEGQVVAHIMPAPSQGYSHSNSASNSTSPNVSPPHSYTSYATQPPYPSYGPQAVPSMGYYDSSPHDTHGSYGYTTQRPMDINLLATAASQVERENPMPHYYAPSKSYSQPYPHPYHHFSYRQAPYPQPSTGSSGPSSLSAYRYSPGSSQPMSRSHSYEDDDPYSHHRLTKRSRPASPRSTNPPSPIFTADSIHSTPNHTPALTPAHSPRMRPQKAAYDTQLPGIKHLSLQHPIPAPTLDTLEPSDQHLHNPPLSSRSRNSSGISISDIISRPDGAQRRLPNPAQGFSFQDSSVSGSPQKHHHILSNGVEQN